jgi:hypothetical protein
MRLLYVDSRDRVSGTSTDFSIQLPETLVLEGNTHRMRIDDLRIPLTIPTIQAGVNDHLSVILGATTYTVTIPQSNYDGPTLASVLQGLLQATAPGTWTVVYDTGNIAMRISCSNNFTIVPTSSYAVQLFAHPYTQTANSYTFTYVSMLGIDMFYLSSSRFANLDTIGPQGSHDTLMSAVVTQPFGSVLDANMPYDTWMNVPALTAQQLDFQLRNRSYQVLSIVPNISFVMTID